MRIFLEKHYKILIALILGFMFVVSVLNAKNDSAIFDETAHIGAAYSYVTQHEIRLNPEHPPLIKDLAGIPLLFMNLKFDTSLPFWTGELPKKWDDGQWLAGRHLLYEVGNNADQILFWARFPVILISLLLGLFIFKWTRELAGKLAGLFALALYAFDPNILGHNHYVTTDIGIAAFTVFSFYYFIKFIKSPTWKNVLLGGLFVGLLQLAKFSSLMAFPIFGIILVVYPLVKMSEGKSRIKMLGEYLGKGVLAFSISIVVVWIAYFANTFHMTKETMSQSIDSNFSQSDTNVKTIYTNKVLHLLNGNSLTRPLSTYGIGIGYVFRRVAGGNGSYFLGHVSSQASRAYFPTVFAIKEPFISLFLMAAALLLVLASALKSLRIGGEKILKNVFEKTKEYVRTNIASVSIGSFIVLYSYLSITGNLNIGLRHLFPIFPFAFILTAKVIFDFIKNRQEERTKKILYFFIIILSAVLAVQTALAYPNYLSYFNESVGGPKNGYQYVTNSNADWGQDLKRLKVFLDEHPEIKNVRVDYFGGGDIEYYLGSEYQTWWDSKRPIEKGWYAISTGFLQGSIYGDDKTAENSYRWLAGIKPDYQVGTSILIYNVK